MRLFKILSHVSITVTDVTNARDFYTGVLGLEEIPRPAFDFPGIWYSLEIEGSRNHLAAWRLLAGQMLR